MLKIKKAWQFFSRHKLSTFFVLAILGFGVYFIVGSGSDTSSSVYQFGIVKRGEVAVGISGTGQVSALTQTDIKPKVSGDVVYLAATQGQNVKAGSLLAQLDMVEAQKAVRDAEFAVVSAELSMEKLKQGSANLDQLKEDAFADIANAFLDLPSIITGAQNIILSDEIRPRAQNNISYYKGFVSWVNEVPFAQVSLFLDTAESDYNLARASYDKAIALYKNTVNIDNASNLDALLSQTLSTTKSLAQVLKSEQNLLDFLTSYAEEYSRSLPSQIATYKSNIRTYIGQVNSHIASLSSAQSSILNAPLDLKSQQLSLTQKENSLSDAKADLSKYYIRAPFDGVIASVPVKKGDSASPSTVIATIVTKQQIAEISFNEVDAAKIKIGQKADMTFDAFPDMKFEGQVTGIDVVGSVSQGVVTYVAQIAFSDSSQRVKPGMSVSAYIVVDSRENVLMVPSGAIKLRGGKNFVEVYKADSLSNNSSSSLRSIKVGSVALIQKEVEVGLASDTETEIVSGLEEGERVVLGTRVLSGSAPSPNSILTGSRPSSGTNTGGFFRAAGGR